MADLLRFKNEHREKYGRLPRWVSLSDGDYGLLVAEYPLVRNHGDKVHGMDIVVIDGVWPDGQAVVNPSPAVAEIVVTRTPVVVKKPGRPVKRG
jgi:hypothetical protein